MLITWTSWDGYNDKIVETMTVNREIWTVSEIGLSEFIIRDGSTIKIHSVTDILNYCKN